MTTRAEIRRYFKDKNKRCGGVRCNYCKQRVPKPSLYRVHEDTYNGENRDVIYAVCSDCIDRAMYSLVWDKWKRW